MRLKHCECRACTGIAYRLLERALHHDEGPGRAERGLGAEQRVVLAPLHVDLHRRRRGQAEIIEPGDADRLAPARGRDARDAGMNLVGNRERPARVGASRRQVVARHAAGEPERGRDGDEVAIGRGGRLEGVDRALEPLVQPDRDAVVAPVRADVEEGAARTGEDVQEKACLRLEAGGELRQVDRMELRVRCAERKAERAPARDHARLARAAAVERAQQVIAEAGRCLDRELLGKRAHRAVAVAVEACACGNRLGAEADRKRREEGRSKDCHGPLPAGSDGGRCAVGAAPVKQRLRRCRVGRTLPASERDRRPRRPKRAPRPRSCPPRRCRARARPRR